MKKNRAFSILLIFGISLLLTLSCAYAGYDDLREADFLATGAKYENQDLDDFFLEKLYPPSAATKSPAGSLLFAEPSLIFASAFSLYPGVTDPAIPVMRC